MSADFTELLAGLRLRPPAPTDTLRQINEAFGNLLPESYLRLMAFSNGLEGFVSADSYLMLWSINDLPELNDEYATNEFVPGIILIGSDGSNTAYGIDTRSKETLFIAAPFETLALDNVERIGSTIEEFLWRIRERQD